MSNGIEKIKKCKHCKQEFTTNIKTKKYCCNKCRKKAEKIRNREYYLNYSKEDYIKNWDRYKEYREKNKNKLRKIK
ncbi:MAG: hypothetical protein M0R17_05830 [Candidatus Omnitrophica bacterium]|jgi:hypothetical protein|nr:hypothetical protein [Candidatus Omnitrophota bacterium]